MAVLKKVINIVSPKTYTPARALGADTAESFTIRGVDFDETSTKRPKVIITRHRFVVTE